MQQRKQASSLLLVLLLLALVATSILAQEETKQQEEQQNVQDRGLITMSVTHDAVMQHAPIYGSNTTKDTSAQITFGFITPWNAQGYVNAKLFASKFSHLSPVWFQCQSPSKKFAITGDHEVQKNKQWIADVKKANGKIKIVPRFELIDKEWAAQDVRNFFKADSKSKQLIDQMAKAIADKVNQYDDLLDGVTLEWGYIQVRRVVEVFQRLLKVLSGHLRKKNKLLFIVAPAPLFLRSDELSRDDSQTFSRMDFKDLEPYVDGVLAMTYDFTTLVTQRLLQMADNNFDKVPKIPGLGPIAPYGWLEAGMEYLASGKKTATSKLFLGLNFYGQDYTVVQHLLKPNAIIGSEYLKLVEKYKPEIKYEEAHKEHYFEYKDDEGNAHKVFYPSLLSLQERLKLARDNKYSVMIWEIGQALPYFFDLL